MNKKIFFNEFKREIYLMIIALVIMLLVLLMTRTVIYDEYYSGKIIFFQIIEITRIFAFVLPFILFSYTSSKEKLDLINALPITRIEMFKTKYFIGLLYFTTPFLITLVTTLVMDSIFYPIPIDFSLNFVLMIVKYYFEYVLFYSISMFACMLTGFQATRVAFAIFISILFLLILGGVFVPILNYIQPYMHFEKESYGLLTNWWFFDDISIKLYTVPQYLLQIILIVIGSVVLFFINLKLYNKRKTENSNEVIVFSKGKKIIWFIVTLVLAFYGSVIFNQTMFNSYFWKNSTYDTIFFLVFFLVSIICVGFLSQQVIEKGSKKNIKKVLKYSILAFLPITTILLIYAYNDNRFHLKVDDDVVRLDYSSTFDTEKIAQNKSFYLTTKEQKERFNKLLDETFLTVDKGEKYLTEYLEYELLNFSDDNFYTSMFWAEATSENNFYDEISNFADEYATSELDAFKQFFDDETISFNMYTNDSQDSKAVFEKAIKTIELKYLEYFDLNGYLNTTELGSDYLYTKVIGEKNRYYYNSYDYRDDGTLYNAIVKDLNNLPEDFDNNYEACLYKLNLQKGTEEISIYINQDFTETLKFINRNIEEREN